MKAATLFLCLICLSIQVEAQRYIFFLHNMFIEEAGLEGVHPDYGRAEYNEIIDAFRKKGFMVISEVRPKGTDGIVYARKVARQIDSLRTSGIKASQITVVGISKGGYIAQYVSGLEKKNHLNFVFIGSCGDYLEEEPEIRWYGNALSIYEKSDKWLSCEKMKNRHGNNVVRYKEIELNTGMKHGYLYKALPQWIEPAARWANGQYK